MRGVYDGVRGNCSVLLRCFAIQILEVDSRSWKGHGSCRARRRARRCGRTAGAGISVSEPVDEPNPPHLGPRSTSRGLTGAWFRHRGKRERGDPALKLRARALSSPAAPPPPRLVSNGSRTEMPAPTVRSGVTAKPPRRTAYHAPTAAPVSRVRPFSARGFTSRVTGWQGDGARQCAPAAAEWGTRGPRGVAAWGSGRSPV